MHARIADGDHAGLHCLQRTGEIARNSSVPGAEDRFAHGKERSAQAHQTATRGFQLSQPHFIAHVGAFAHNAAVGGNETVFARNRADAVDRENLSTSSSMLLGQVGSSVGEDDDVALRRAQWPALAHVLCRAVSGERTRRTPTCVANLAARWRRSRHPTHRKRPGSRGPGSGLRARSRSCARRRFCFVAAGDDDADTAAHNPSHAIARRAPRHERRATADRVR